MKLTKTIALLDANVLYPAPIRDILLHFAEERMFQPKWTKRIEQEWTKNLLKNRPDLKLQSIERTAKAMNIAFPNALVKRYEGIIRALQLPDPNDRHVLAAAIRAVATHIVTINTKDFPQKYINSYWMEVIHPDQFICNLIINDYAIARSTFEKMINKFTSPPLTREKVLASLLKCGLPESARLLK